MTFDRWDECQYGYSPGLSGGAFESWRRLYIYLAHAKAKQRVGIRKILIFILIIRLKLGFPGNSLKQPCIAAFRLFSTRVSFWLMKLVSHSPHVSHLLDMAAFSQTCRLHRAAPGVSSSSSRGPVDLPVHISQVMGPRRMIRSFAEPHNSMSHRFCIFCQDQTRCKGQLSNCRSCEKKTNMISTKRNQVPTNVTQL